MAILSKNSRIHKSKTNHKGKYGLLKEQNVILHKRIHELLSLLSRKNEELNILKELLELKDLEIKNLSIFFNSKLVFIFKFSEESILFRTNSK